MSTMRSPFSSFLLLSALEGSSCLLASNFDISKYKKIFICYPPSSHHLPSQSSTHGFHSFLPPQWLCPRCCYSSVFPPLSLGSVWERSGTALRFQVMSECCCWMVMLDGRESNSCRHGHLSGVLPTVMGIQPFRPVSNRGVVMTASAPPPLCLRIHHVSTSTTALHAS